MNVNYINGCGLELADVVDLESAKKLKCLGFVEPTHWYYVDSDNIPFVAPGLKRVKYDREQPINHNEYDDFIYSAPTRVQVEQFMEIK